MAEFKKLYDYSGKPDKTQVLVRRMPVPVEIINRANQMFLSDAKPYGERPTQRDIILQMAMKGFSSLKDSTVYEKQNKTLSYRDRVFWIPNSFRDLIKTRVSDIQDGKFDKTGKYKIAMSDIWIQALNSIK